jgi:hypothetical protein
MGFVKAIKKMGIDFTMYTSSKSLKNPEFSNILNNLV